jgi:hypothetical protein
VRLTFVIISLSDRLRDLNALLGLLHADARWHGIDRAVLFQDPSQVVDQIVWPQGPYRTQLFVVPDKLGQHWARVELLRRLATAPYDVYINLDDDMEPGPYTNYGPMVKKALEPEVGFVMSNWARTPALLTKKLPMLHEVLHGDPEDAFEKQIMLYNGGGSSSGSRRPSTRRGPSPRT